MSNCKVIALTNQKGGVGKTTTAVNLGVSLAQQGKKVLLIDADAQANLTMSLGYNRPDDLPVTLSTIMQDIIDDNPIDVQKSILHHGEGVDLLPSNIELSGLEVRLINAISRESVLKTCVNEVKKNYDYCLIDCMPSLGMLTINALAAADSVVIPTQPHYLSAKGLELLLRSVSKVKRQINPPLRIDGILMTMVMPRTNISKEITATVRSAYGQKIKVFDTQIPHSIRAVEATAEGKSIFAYDKGGKDKAEQGYYAEENSATEYAADKISHTADRVKDEGIHQFNKQGQKSVQTTKENIVKAKDKVAEFKTKRAMKAAEQKKAQAAAERNGSQIRHGTVSRSSAPDAPANGKSQLIKTRQQGKKTIKTTAKNAEKTVKSAAKGTVKAAEKGVKTAQATSKTAIKTTEQTVKAAQKTAKASAKAAQKAAQAAKATAKATAEATKATVKATIAAVKAIIAGTKALVSALIAGGWIAVVIILIVVLLGCAVSLFGGGSESTSYTPVSAEVEAYTPLIQKYAKQYGIPEYVELIKAVMMQESGGRGLDPMQAAEGSFNTRYPHEPNGIQDPEYSIQCGVQELKAALISAEVENPIDMERIKLALQGYNFGNGYISWAKTNYGGYSYANAVEFSTMQARRLGWEKYGDTQYPAHVLRYYPYGRAFTSGGNQAIVEVALTQLGNEGGQPYWSWYGFEGRVEWCACFVSWCADQCGYLESGIVPKFSLCSDGVDWFNGNGQWQGKDYEPKAGDIIFFDWSNDGQDGDADHVGIVEKCENGVVYTVEGNSGDACRQNSYPVGYYEILGYGCPRY